MATVDYFVKLDGIEGDASDGSIEIMSFSWGVTNSGSIDPGGGGGTGKATFQDLSFTSAFNKASPALFKACATGQHIRKATLVVRKQGEGTFDYNVSFEDLLVSSYQSGGSAEGDIPLEQVSLNYAKIEF